MKNGYSPGCRSGLTMIELMIVVTVIGLLAVMAIPSIKEARRRARDAAFINDLRNLANNVFCQYALHQSDYPPDAAPGVLPAGVSEYMHRRYDFAAETPIGGNWDWDRAASTDQKVHGCYAGLSVYLPDRTSAQMAQIDRQMGDDGDLSSGMFRSRADGYIYILEP